MNKNKIILKPGCDVITGLRPTRTLTIANYIGAVKPIIDIQNESNNVMLFIADIHALTTHELKETQPYILEILADYIALGVDPEKVKIFLQSDIKNELFELTMELCRHISVAELLRVPTLKEKIKQGAPENANAFLLLYPVLMAADILLQRSKRVPVGKDQLPHIELTRRLAKKFNERYQPTFVIPTFELNEYPIIMSLKGDQKMSKSYPEQAIFLNDDEETLRKKITSAETAESGVVNDIIESHFNIVRELSSSQDELNQLEDIFNRHQDGEKVMQEFKQLFADVVVSFCMKYQSKRKKTAENQIVLKKILDEGGIVAKRNAQETLDLMRAALIA